MDPRKAWERACRAAGHPGLLIHDLRRSAVRNMEQAGVRRSVAMKLTGHKTENVYRRLRSSVTWISKRRRSKSPAGRRPSRFRHVPLLRPGKVSRNSL